ncbi:glycosyltransferase family 10 fucosyltransferase [Oricola sp.]|uniref:glycosyltransferase family 10 fucosyltransferase n=1 Tax=Oricola sp. TaxID=1979950 RepID=UPI0025EBC512|nr:glycosyltransferase family 10 fucosyltransferase [Oricola sp.]MCI5073604.1 glycosyltransferase family 10 fucosyltransferase [Oricola sp.]
MRALGPGARSGDSRERPVILFYNDFFGRPPDTRSLARCDGCIFTTDRRAYSKAAAVVFHVPSMRKLPRLRKRRGQLWVAWSMESDVNYPLLRDRDFMGAFDLTMTYRRSSDVWCSYLPWASAFEDAVSAPLPDKTADAPVVMLQSASIDRSGRIPLARELMNRIPVHSYGRFMNNRQFPLEDRGSETKRALIGSYKFCIAFENSIAVDYVTEKLFDPLLAGSVPVYLGAPNADSFAPASDSFINASKFAGPAELAEYLTWLDSDDEAYRQYFRWRERGLSPQFRQLLSDAEKEPFWHLCEIVAARSAEQVRRWQWPWRS